MALHQEGRLDEAAALYEAVIAQAPEHADAHQLLGLIALNTGNAPRAVDLIRRALEIDPSSFGAHVNLGASYKALGQRELAVESYDTAVSLRPDYVDGWIHAGNLLGELHRIPEALARFDAALRADPDHAGALNNRGNALRRLGQHEAALECFDQSLARDNSRHDARLNRGVVLMELGRDAEALTEYNKLLVSFPSHALAWNNRGNVLLRLRRYAEAVDSLDRALDLAPDYPPAWVNRANAMLALCQYDHARSALEHVRTLVPSLAEAQWNLANLDLLQGRFDSGWRHFEARWRAALLEPRRHEATPVWLGETDVRGKRVMLWHEQGFGDTIQFARFARDVAALGAIPVVEVQPALKPLMAASLEGIEVIATGEPTAPCDYATPLMSLPLALRVDVSSLPAAPYLRAELAHVQAHAAALGPRRAPLRVAIAMSGNTKHRNDANRSIALRDFARMVRGVETVVVQKGLRADDSRVISRYPDFRYVGDALSDFSDTAAVIENCDLVISVDTSVVHLAAALGKPVWVLLPANPDWRWQLGREDSPWYPSARLFRQTKPGDWTDVYERVARELEMLAANTTRD